MKIGIGYDIHKLIKNKPLILGGIIIPYPKGLLGHSDGDALTHSIIDALLGAASLGDIGEYFPDTELQYKGISSLVLLEKINNLILKNNYKIINIDTIIILEKPKIFSYKYKMIEKLSKCLNINKTQINIKATTNEGLGIIGENKGVACKAISLIEKKDFDK